MKIRTQPTAPLDEFEYKIIDTVTENWCRRLTESSVMRLNIILTELFWHEAETLASEQSLSDYVLTAIPIQSQAHEIVGGGGDGGVFRLYLNQTPNGRVRQQDGGSF